MTMNAKLKGSSQQAKGDVINRRNGQGPQHLKFFLLMFLNIKAQAQQKPKPKMRPKPNT